MRRGPTPKRPSVLVVGQGPPAAGGIPTFVDRLSGDRWLGERYSMRFLNTTPSSVKRPAGLTTGNLRQLLRDTDAVFRNGRRSDVVHLNMAPAPLLPLMRSLMLVVAAKVAGARVLLHAHTGRLHTSMERRTYRLLAAVVVRIADAFVVVSRQAEAALRPLGGSVTRVLNGIDTAETTSGPKSVDPLVIAFVGTVCERKGLLDLRDALLRLREADLGRDFEVVIVGDDRQEGPGVFERIERAYTDVPNVTFTGAVDRVEVLEHLRRATVFCLPSHWEGLPLSLLEAMAAENAVIASGVGDVPEALDHGKAGIIVAPRDPSALAGEMRRLISEPGYVERLGKAAGERVRARYTFATTARELDALYSRLVHSMYPRPRSESSMEASSSAE